MNEVAAAQLPRLLAVDDEQDMLDFIGRALRRHFRVQTCSDLASATTALANTKVEVLLCDLSVGHDNGLSFLAGLGPHFVALTRVLLTGYADDRQLETALAGGTVDGVAGKPIDGVALLETIDRARACRAQRLAQAEVRPVAPAPV